MQTHRTVLHNIRNYTNVARLRATDRLSLISPFGSAASASALFGSLLNGAMVCPFNMREKGVEALSEWLIAQGITVYHSVPTVFRELVTVLGPSQRCSQLRLVKLGGERVDRKDITLYRQHFAPGCTLLVSFGATEINLIAYHIVDAEDTFLDGIVPVGCAPEGVEISVVDESGRVVPRGTIGEILVKSGHLSPGYWGQAELTEATFIRNVAAPGQRCYRTGDIGRLLPDGRLLHLGRRDGRVMIRGQTVEIAEVEAALTGLDAIKEVAVVDRPDGDGQSRLVAYVVLSRDITWTADEIRRVARTLLPEFMVPSALVVMESLPKTPNGKIDRKALPEPMSPSAPQEGGDTARRTPTEELVTEIWAEVLGVERPGLHENFFEIGGHSLRAIQVVSRVRDALGLEVPLRGTFERPTIAEFAVWLNELMIASDTPAS